MAKGTPATIAVQRLGLAHTLHEYTYDPNAERVGLQAAEALGEDPGRVLKTLMLLIDGKPACAILPSDRELALKKVAAAFGGKSAAMMPPAQAERLTGYVVGGISPFGQKKRVPVAIEAAALEHDRVYLNGGRRGLQIRLSPRDAADALGAVASELVA
ncbi:MAG TPA: Cys-tRNA(Pro) deacylase [Bradyrhizobium sp.]|nr:Cys-tRNA(Pro) deacylase [Bradyrhizobium sp.]